ncbi:MAG TPA: nuclear transport factor 2 family protein [Pyrinomonadaceae bacterium]|nr:nuclear transport factor 2 family protein [Pyrinomonadaceae bacterium]
MLKRLVTSAVLIFVTSTVVASAQNSNSSTTVRPRTTTTQSNTNKAAETPTPEPAKSTDTQPAAASTPAARRATPAPKTAAAETPGSQGVVTAFNALINGIRRADVKAVSNVYWNSPRLILFSNNGTVTKGWEQMRRNRESSYKDVKDVKLEVRDVSITMLGRDGAVVSCLWTQSQTYRGTPETATGRMTLVFRRVGQAWRAMHLHTSPDRPDPSRVLPSEQTTSSTPNP